MMSAGDHNGKAESSMTLAHNLSRTVVTSDDIVLRLSIGNVLAVLDSHEGKLSLLRLVLGQSIVSQQSAEGSSTHRVILFVTDDGLSTAQYATELETMDLTVAPYTSDMHTSGTDHWPNIMANDIIVVAANMLLDSLADGSFRLSQVHLIVISDAQRILPMVAPHPVLKIMSDFYSKIADPPKLLALLTSAPHRWPALDLSRLEVPLLASAVFLQTPGGESWSAPMELVIEYDRYSLPEEENSLSTGVRNADPQERLVKSHHKRDAALVLSQLGPHAVNLFWRDAIRHALNNTSLQDSALAAARDSLNALQGFIPDEKLDADVHSEQYNVTPKFTRLVKVLQPCTAYGNDLRAMVLVKDGAVALVLASMLSAALPFLRTNVLAANTWRDPAKTNAVLQDFSAGVHNLLVMTKSYEDVDTAPASMIVNFDLFDDQLSYAYTHIHSKGSRSHLVHMLERDNNEHRRIISRYQTVDADVRAWITGTVYDEVSFPPRTMYISLNPYRSAAEDEVDDGDHITDPTTSARLYKPDAVAALYRFVAEVHNSLPQDGQASITLEESKGTSNEVSYLYNLTFPASTRLPPFVGTYCRTKWEARREVCYQACKELVRVGLMNSRHFPQSQSITPGGSLIVLDVRTPTAYARTHGYPRKFPDFWPNSTLSLSTVLYPTIVAPEPLGEKEHAPVLLLTRAPLPLVPDCNVYFCGARATVHFYKGVPIEVNEGQLKALHGYTTRVMRSLTNKSIEYGPGTLLCLYAPLGSEWHTTLSKDWPLLSVAEHIQWDAVQLAADYYSVPLLDATSSIDDRARDAIVIDRQVEFTLRHFVVKVRHDMTPLSKAEDSPREAEFANFLEYCKARIKDFQGLEDEKQPMLEVSPIPSILNLLHPASAPPNTPPKTPLKYMIPELCHKFTIPASTYRTLWLMPSIMDRLDSAFLTKELNAKLFHNTILEQQLLIALSPPVAFTEINYERLEFLGDSFLKVVASNFCYASMPTSEIAKLHDARGTIVSNKVLQEGAAHVGLPCYIQQKRFVARLWRLPVIDPGSFPSFPTMLSMTSTSTSMESVRTEDADGDVEMADGTHDQEQDGAGARRKNKKQRQREEQNILWLGNKTIADVVEAVIAASFLSGGHEVALQTVRRLKVPIPNVAQWSDYVRIAAEHVDPLLTPASAPTPTPATIQAVEGIVRAQFRRPELLGQALTHTSTFSGDQGTSYDRLEFIGDAILDFLVSRYIWERHPFLSPGGLTMLKSAMVSNQTLAALSVHIGLHKHLKIESSPLSLSIEKYIDFLGELRKKEYDFAARENRLPGQYWLDLPIEPPKCLSDVVESVLGALYVGDNFFEVGVGQFFESVFKPFVDAHIRLQTLSTNPRTTLLEFLQAEGCQHNAVTKQPAPRQGANVTMDVIIHDQVLTSASDPSGAIATRKVSLAALDMLMNDPQYLQRVCDCKSASGPAKKQPAKRAEPEPDEDEAEDEDAAEVEAAMGEPPSMDTEADQDA